MFEFKTKNDAENFDAKKTAGIANKHHNEIKERHFAVPNKVHKLTQRTIAAFGSVVFSLGYAD